MSIVAELTETATTSLADFPHRKFTVAEYHSLADKGVFGRQERIELWDGEFISMSPIGTRHAGIVDQLAEYLRNFLEGKVIVRVQNPLVLDDFTEPEPDLTILHRREDFYKGSNVTAADVFLVIEVADTSLRYDREIKLPGYAAAGIQEAWLVDLQNDRVEIFTDPSPTGYRLVRILSRGDTAASSVFPEVQIAVSDLIR
jgi:Uma2 family endonuclease